MLLFFRDFFESFVILFPFFGVTGGVGFDLFRSAYNLPCLGCIFDFSAGYKLNSGVSESCGFNRASIYCAAAGIGGEAAKLFTLRSSAYNVDCIVLFACAFFYFQQSGFVLHRKAFVYAPDNFADCFGNFLTCFFTVFPDSFRHISRGSENRVIRVYKAGERLRFFSQRFKLSERVFIALFCPATAALLNKPKTYNVFKERGFVLCSRLICNIAGFGIFINYRSVKLSSEK